MEPKAGWKSTEFWTMIIANLFGFFSLPPEQAAILVGGLSAVYTSGRSIVKLIKAR